MKNFLYHKLSNQFIKLLLLLNKKNELKIINLYCYINKSTSLYRNFSLLSF